MGYEHLVYTDIARDGMQTGVENDAYAKMAASADKGAVRVVED